MRSKESSLNLVLNLAKQAREHKVAFLNNYPIDKSILEFAQKKGFISYRNERELSRQRSNIKKLEEEFILDLEKQFKPQNPYTWVLSSLEDCLELNPIIFPESINEIKMVVSHKQNILQLLKSDTTLFKKNEELKTKIIEFKKLTNPIYNYINQLFISGLLENEIQIYLEKKQGKTRISRALVANFLEPQKAEIVQEDGELPSLNISERQIIQFLFWKLENMNKREESLKKLLLDERKENPKRNGYLVVFEQQEAIQINYGIINASGYHHIEIKDALKSLCEKNRKLILKTKNEELRISIPLLKRIEIEHKYSIDPEFKKYIAVYIDENVVNLHLQYTSYPKNHFALLRTTPPQTRLNESETAFFDFLYSEVSYNKTKINVVKRKKTEFIAILDINGSFKKGSNLSKLGERIENVFIPKASNLGLLQEFYIEKNKEGEEIYVFNIAPREKISHLF
jgi:hypothetical protein